MKTLAQPSSESKSDSRNLIEIAFNRAETGLALANRLKSVSHTPKSNKLAYNASKLQKCCSLKNMYLGLDMHGEFGDAFVGIGSLFACNLAYCPNCVATKARENRKKIRTTLELIKPLVGQNWFFITLTSPSIRKPLLDSINANIRAFKLFRKREFWNNSIALGYRGIEFTVNPVTKLNHVHIHILVLSKFLRPATIRANWQECIETAWSEQGIDELNIGPKGIVIDVRPIARKENRASIDSAIQETAKYMAKSDAWLALSDSDLASIATLERFPRLFEALGKGRNSPDAHSILNTFNTYRLKDGKINSQKNDVLDTLDTLHLRASNRRKWFKSHLLKSFPSADFVTLDGERF